MISGKLSDSDFLAAQRLHRRRSSRGVTVASLIVAAAGAVVLLAADRAAGLALLTVAVCGLPGEGAQNYLLLPWQARRLYRQCAAFRQTFRYFWDEDHLADASDDGNSRSISRPTPVRTRRPHPISSGVVRRRARGDFAV